MSQRPQDRRGPITKREFIADLGSALERGTGYAAGRLSYSHVHRLSYRVTAQRLEHPDLILKGAEDRIHFESLNQLGIFPPDMAFYPRFDAFWVEHLQNLDCVGVIPDRLAPSLHVLDHYDVPGKRINFRDLEPDRSVPSRDEACYLPLFADKRVLLICPFASLLGKRAKREIFEAVWAKTGKSWFGPRSVDALEFPYGFAQATHQLYPNAIDLFESIQRDLQTKSFDVALIGAAGLAVPIASHIKKMGKLAIDLGGHLQIVFGVLGKRWRAWGDWRERYFNDAWIDMPARFRPAETGVCDSGAYW